MTEEQNAVRGERRDCFEIVTDDEVSLFRRVKRERDAVDDPYATHRAIEAVLRHKYVREISRQGHGPRVRRGEA